MAAGLRTDNLEALADAELQETFLEEKRQREHQALFSGAAASVVSVLSLDPRVGIFSKLTTTGQLDQMKKHSEKKFQEAKAAKKAKEATARKMAAEERAKKLTRVLSYGKSQAKRSEGYEGVPRDRRGKMNDEDVFKGRSRTHLRSLSRTSSLASQDRTLTLRSHEAPEEPKTPLQETGTSPPPRKASPSPHAGAVSQVVAGRFGARLDWPEGGDTGRTQLPPHKRSSARRAPERGPSRLAANKAVTSAAAVTPLPPIRISDASPSPGASIDRDARLGLGLSTVELPVIGRRRCRVCGLGFLVWGLGFRDFVVL